MESITESKIVTSLSVIIAVSFAINIFYYGLSDGTWFTFGLYDQLFDAIGDATLRFLDAIFM